MVKKQDETQAGIRQSAEKPQSGQQKVEQQKTEQQARNRLNSQGYNQNQRGQNQLYQQSGGPAVMAKVSNNRDGQGYNQGHSGQNGQGLNQKHNQSQLRNSSQGSRSQPDRHDGNPREISQNKGYYRDRNRDNDRDAQPRQYTGTSSSGAKYGNSLRNKPDETIDDIKEDIIRLEKEIELEIKDIKSLKL